VPTASRSARVGPEAYYTEFSRNGGKHPLVVSYATSPAAELFYAKDRAYRARHRQPGLAGAVFRRKSRAWPWCAAQVACSG